MKQPINCKNCCNKKWSSSNHLAFVTEHSNTKAERLRIDSSGRLLHKTLSYSPEWGGGLISHKPESVTTTYFRPSGQYSLGKVDNLQLNLLQ